MSLLQLREHAPRVIENRVKPRVRWGVQHAIPRQALRGAAGKGDAQARLTVEAPQLLPEDIGGLFQDIRARGRVVDGQFARVTVDHACVKDVLTSNDFRTGFVGEGSPVLARLGAWSQRAALHPMEPPSLLVTEGDDHTRYRKLVSRVFTARAVENMRSRTQEIANDLLNAMAARAAAGHEVDLASEYCALLPVTVIAEILGVPESERADVLRMGTYAAASLDFGVGWKRFKVTEEALAEFDAWMGDHLASLRANPGDDLLSRVVTAQDNGQGLSERELRSLAGLLLAAGFETTVNLLGNSIRLLVDHPEQLGLLRSGEAEWSNAVEESLRYDPPVLLTARTSMRDTAVGGVPITKDTILVTVLAGAGRDPEVFDDPDTFDVTRENAREHLAFSAGRHFCLGAALARMEGEVGLRSLFDRFDITLADGARRRPTRILRGYEHLPARLVERA